MSTSTPSIKGGEVLDYNEGDDRWLPYGRYEGLVLTGGPRYRYLQCYELQLAPGGSWRLPGGAGLPQRGPHGDRVLRLIWIGELP